MIFLSTRGFNAPLLSDLTGFFASELKYFFSNLYQEGTHIWNAFANSFQVIRNNKFISFRSSESFSNYSKKKAQEDAGQDMVAKIDKCIQEAKNATIK